MVVVYPRRGRSPGPSRQPDPRAVRGRSYNGGASELDPGAARDTSKPNMCPADEAGGSASRGSNGVDGCSASDD